MKASNFVYERPVSLADAVAKLAASDGAATPISGGQSLLVLMGLRLTAAETLVDISRLPELQDVGDRGSLVRIGAAVTHAAIEDGRVPDPSMGLMPKVASKIAYRAVRNLGTIGGSMALADPSADWPACLIALDATVLIEGPDGTRSERAEDFVIGPYTTTLNLGEIVTGFEIRRRDNARWGTWKVARKSGAYADSFAVAVAVSSAGEARVALTGTTSHARLLPGASRCLGEGLMDDETLRRAILADLAAVDPEAEPYRLRCHVASVSRAVREAGSR